MPDGDSNLLRQVWFEDYCHISRLPEIIALGLLSEASEFLLSSVT